MSNEIQDVIFSNSNPNRAFAFRKTGNSTLSDSFRLAQFANDTEALNEFKALLETVYPGRTVTPSVISGISGTTTKSARFRFEFSGNVNVPLVQVRSGAVQNLGANGGDTDADYSWNDGDEVELGISQSDFQDNQREIGGSKHIITASDATEGATIYQDVSIEANDTVSSLQNKIRSKGGTLNGISVAGIPIQPANGNVDANGDYELGPDTYNNGPTFICTTNDRLALARQDPANPYWYFIYMNQPWYTNAFTYGNGKPQASNQDPSNNPQLPPLDGYGLGNPPSADPQPQIQLELTYEGDEPFISAVVSVEITASSPSGPPTGYLFSGAGDTRANQLFADAGGAGSDGVPSYEASNGSSIFRSPSAGGRWYLMIDNFGGISYHNSNYASDVPPLTGWVVDGSTDAPAPFGIEVYGIANPTDYLHRDAPPDLDQDIIGGGSLAINDYEFAYTFVNGIGETMLSPVSVAHIEISGRLVVLPNFSSEVVGAIGANFYCRIQGSPTWRYIGTSADNFVYTGPFVDTGPTAPTENTTGIQTISADLKVTFPNAVGEVPLELDGGGWEGEAIYHNNADYANVICIGESAAPNSAFAVKVWDFSYSGVDQSATLIFIDGNGHVSDTQLTYNNGDPNELAADFLAWPSVTGASVVGSMSGGGGIRNGNLRITLQGSNLPNIVHYFSNGSSGGSLASIQGYKVSNSGDTDFDGVYVESGSVGPAPYYARSIGLTDFFLSWNAANSAWVISHTAGSIPSSSNFYSLDGDVSNIPSGGWKESDGTPVPSMTVALTAPNAPVCVFSGAGDPDFDGPYFESGAYDDPYGDINPAYANENGKVLRFKDGYFRLYNAEDLNNEWYRSNPSSTFADGPVRAWVGTGHDDPAPIASEFIAGTNLLLGKTTSNVTGGGTNDNLPFTTNTHIVDGGLRPVGGQLATPSAGAGSFYYGSIVIDMGSAVSLGALRAYQYDANANVTVNWYGTNNPNGFTGRSLLATTPAPTQAGWVVVQSNDQTPYRYLVFNHVSDIAGAQNRYTEIEAYEATLEASTDGSASFQCFFDVAAIPAAPIHTGTGSFATQVIAPNSVATTVQVVTIADGVGPGPIIQSFYPPFVSAGDWLTVYGQYLSEITSVRISGRLVKEIIVVSDSEIRILVPLK